MDEELLKELTDKFVGKPDDAVTRQQMTDTILNYFIKKNIEEREEELQARAIKLANDIMNIQKDK